MTKIFKSIFPNAKKDGSTWAILDKLASHDSIMTKDAFETWTCTMYEESGRSRKTLYTTLERMRSAGALEYYAVLTPFGNQEFKQAQQNSTIHKDLTAVVSYLQEQHTKSLLRPSDPGPHLAVPIEAFRDFLGKLFTQKNHNRRAYCLNKLVAAECLVYWTYLTDEGHAEWERIRNGEPSVVNELVKLGKEQRLAEREVSKQARLAKREADASAIRARLQKPSVIVIRGKMPEIRHGGVQLVAVQDMKPGDRPSDRVIEGNQLWSFKMIQDSEPACDGE